MFCKYCGTEIDENSAFCNKCGKSLTQNTVSESLTTKGKHNRFSKKGILLILIIVLIALIVAVVFNVLTGVTIVNKTVEAGSVVTTKDIVKAKWKSATVTIQGEVDTTVLGEKKISCIVDNGLFETTKSFTIHVVDTTAPVISGPTAVSIICGHEFDSSLYYQVDDFEKNLENKIEVTPSINVDSEETQEVILSVKDSSGNEGTLPITVKTLKLTKNEEVALAAINQYVADGKQKDEILSSVWVMKTSGAENGVDYYVEVADNILYAIYFSGEVSEFTVSDCGGASMRELMVYAVHYNGITVSSSKLIN